VKSGNVKISGLTLQSWLDKIFTISSNSAGFLLAWVLVFPVIVLISFWCLHLWFLTVLINIFMKQG